MSKRSSRRRREHKQQVGTEVATGASGQTVSATEVAMVSATEVAMVSAAEPGNQEDVAATAERPSSIPPETLQAYDDMLRSSAAVLQSLRIRVPAALAERVRRSSVPPPPVSAGQQ